MGRSKEVEKECGGVWKWDREWALLIDTSVLGLKKKSISTSSDPARDFRRALQELLSFSMTFAQIAVPFDQLGSNRPLNLAPKRH